MKLHEYFEHKERASWDKTYMLTELRYMLQNCKMDRQEWDKQARWGRQVQKYDLSFMSKHFANKKDSTEVWGINFIESNIKYTVASQMKSDIEASLVSDNGETSKAQRLLEAKLNYSIDKFRILRKSDQPLYDVEYTGMAYGITSWNPKNQDGIWFNGKPDYRIIMPESVWLDPAIQAKDKSDCRYIFYEDQYVTKNLRRISPELHNLVDDHYTNLEIENGGHKVERQGIITVCHYLYKRTFNMKRRAIVNEENPKVKWFIEDEWEETIKQFTQQEELLPEEMEKFKQMGELPDETAVLPEGLRTTKSIESEIDFWFEVMFIPNLNIQINEPIYRGVNCPISILHGNYSPGSAYSFSNAWKMKSPLELSILNMTIQFFDTVKKNRPIISIMPGAFINEKEIRERWGDPNLIAYPDPIFFEKNPHLKPEDCLFAFKMPQSGQMQLLLDEKLNKAAADSQATPEVSKGIQPYAGMPDRSIARLQQAASTGSKNSYVGYEEFIRNTVEVLKELLIENVDYKHQMLAPDDLGRPGMEKINYDSDSMLANAEDSIVEIKLEENSEYAKIIKEEKLKWAYQVKDENGLPLIMSGDLLQGLLPQDFERFSNSKKQFLESNPAILQQALGQLPQQQGEVEHPPIAQ